VRALRDLLAASHAQVASDDDHLLHVVGVRQ
jgi:hypothetical protein